MRLGRRMETSEEYPVFLNVYEEAQWFNRYLSAFGLAVYHTAVEVHGVEYAYGVHGKSSSGIYPSVPRQDDLLPESFKFRESLLLGYTTYTKDKVRSIIAELGGQFPGNGYHCLTKNCNIFSTQLSQILCKKDPPSYINRTARLAATIPFADKMFAEKEYGRK